MARVYVGTYNAYNNGSLRGGWLDLANYASYGDFLKACKNLHRNERDPEFMIQDTEDFPDGLSCMEWLSEQDFNDVKAAMQEDEKTNLTIVDYSEKAFAVIGDTKSVKDDLKKLGGRFNGKLSCGAGWIFSNKSREAVERFISSGEVANMVRQERKESTSNEGVQFVAWLDEFLATCDKSDQDYYKKHNVGAIKLHDGYYLIEKPSIDNRFCFHDEGPQYDLYNELTSNDERMARYFKSKNLATFDNKIERITKGENEWNKDKRVWWNACYNDGRIELRFHSVWNDDKGTLCTDEEKAIILKGLQFGRALFEKRLDAYLKRYGVSKLHTWTYWADA